MKRTILLLTVVAAMLLIYAGPVFAQQRIPPDLAIEYHQGPSKAATGEEVYYYVYMTNKGGTTATVPAGTVIASQTFTGAQSISTCYGSGGYTCNSTGTETVEFVAQQDTTLGVGASLYFYAHVIAPTTTGKITNKATLDPSEAIAEVSETNNTSDTISTYVGTPPATDLSVTQSDTPDPVYLGGWLTYTLKVTNYGEDTAFNALIEDYLPKDATYYSGHTSSYGSCYFITEYQAVVCPLGDLQSGKSTEVTIYLYAPQAEGTISNTATVYSDYGDNEPSNDTSKEDTVVKVRDVTPPDTTITSGPSGTVNTSSASFSFSSSESDSSFQCSLDEEAFSSCTSPKEYTNLSTGRHYFRVMATDASGNTDYDYASREWIVDATAPVAKAPAQSFVSSSALGASTVPVKLTWSATDDSSGPGGNGIASYVLQRSVNGGTYSNVTLPSATATTITPSLNPSYTYRYRVQAKDNAGNTSAWAYGPSFKVAAYQETSTGVSYPAGSWPKSAYSSAYFGGYTKYSTSSGAKAKLSFYGRNISWVAPRFTTSGQAYVYVDGVYAGTVTLKSSTTMLRQVVFTKSWATPGNHTIEIRRVGAAGPRVDVDAFVALQ